MPVLARKIQQFVWACLASIYKDGGGVLEVPPNLQLLNPA